MTNFLKVVGAPFEYNGRLWNDDPTRLLTPEDYAEGSTLHPHTFANDVVIYEPSQMFKPVFWEKTGYTSWEQVKEAILASDDAKWACALYRTRYGLGDAITYSGAVGASIFEYGPNTAAEYIRAASGNMEQWRQPCDMYHVDQNYIERHNPSSNPRAVLPVLVGDEGERQEQEPTIIHITTNTLWTYTRPFSNAVQSPSNPLEGVEIKCANEMNYTADVTSQISGFMKTPKDKNSEVYLGLELEVSTDVSVRELQYIVQHVEPKQEVFFACKHDGSVDTSRQFAYEIVTVPMTPARMRQEFRTLFAKLDKLCKAKGKVLNDLFYSSTKNGLHIHIAKKAFEGDTRELRKAGSNWGSKFLAAFNSDFMQEINLLKTVSRRDDYVNNSYCGISDAASRGRRVAYRVGTKHLSIYQTKYSPAHGNKSKTYEVRLFAGLVDIDHIICSIDMVEAMYYFTGCHGAPLCVRFADAFKNWLVTQTGYRALKLELLKK